MCLFHIESDTVNYFRYICQGTSRENKYIISSIYGAFFNLKVQSTLVPQGGEGD